MCTLLARSTALPCPNWTESGQPARLVFSRRRFRQPAPRQGVFVKLSLTPAVNVT